MPGQLVKVRPVDALESTKIIQNEFRGEMIIQILGIFNETMLVVACIFFFEFMPQRLNTIGMLMWSFGCLFCIGVSIYNFWDYFHLRSRHKGEGHHELFELIMYAVCHFTYFIGCLVYTPWFYKRQKELLVGHIFATWLWIWGSVALVLACHWNAIGLWETTTRLPNCRRTTVLRRTASVALTCTAVGAALFLAGSFLFRPGFRNECESPEAFTPSRTIPSSKRSFSHMIHPDKLPVRFLEAAGAHRFRGDYQPSATEYELNPFCVSIIKQGTLLFLIGCVAFWLHAILNAACTVLLHRIRLEDAKREYTMAYSRSSSEGRFESEGSSRQSDK